MADRLVMIGIVRQEGVREQTGRRPSMARNRAEKQGRTTVFVDESGLSQRPHRCRTWAPRGQTPVLQYHFNWKTISVAAGMTFWNFYFQIFDKAVGKEETVVFLAHLLQHLADPLLIVWGR